MPRRRERYSGLPTIIHHMASGEVGRLLDAYAHRMITVMTDVVTRR